jgi:tetratricopeptide (TPR) repeat protein
MKKIYPFALLLVLTVATESAFAQSKALVATIADAACICFGDLSSLTAQAQQARIDSCVPQAMATAVMNGSEQDKKVLGNVKSIQNTFAQVKQHVKNNCNALLSLSDADAMNVKYSNYDDDKDSKYVMSHAPAANKHYLKGNKLVKNGNFKAAAKSYQKAVNTDDQFVMAFDNLAICYRRMQDFDKAIYYYQQSLAIHPDGEVALQNIGMAYMYKNDAKAALPYFKHMIALNADNPEGYFGCAKAYLMLNDCDAALVNTLNAHKLYAATNHPYITDSESLLAYIYQEYEKKNQTATFHKIASENGVEINIGR